MTSGLQQRRLKVKQFGFSKTYDGHVWIGPEKQLEFRHMRRAALSMLMVGDARPNGHTPIIPIDHETLLIRLG